MRLLVCPLVATTAMADARVDAKNHRIAVTASKTEKRHVTTAATRMGTDAVRIANTSRMAGNARLQAGHVAFHPVATDNKTPVNNVMTKISFLEMAALIAAPRRVTNVSGVQKHAANAQRHSNAN